MRSYFVLDQGRFLGEQVVEYFFGEGGVGGGDLGFDSALDGGFDLGGGGYVRGWVEAFEHGSTLCRWCLMVGC